MASSKKKENKNRELPKRWVACPIEEQYLKEGRKDSRVERKRLASKDRSKYKKTDRGKFETGLKKEIKERGEDKDLLRGRVLSITSQGVIVDCEGETCICFLRGLLKKEKTQHKNLVTVGDFVLFERLPDNEGFIVEIEPRQSMLSRADNLSRKKEQLIAANIDQVLITVSVVSPPLKSSLIDRYIIAAQKGHMKPVVIINKVDLLESDDIDLEIRQEQASLLAACEEAYRKVGITLIKVSAEKKHGIDQLKESMKGFASVFSGQSGTGKSSLINAVANLTLPVGETVQKTGKGAHTTTRAHLVPLDCGGWCIDTPGIKSFGVWNLSKEELESYFTEIQERSSDCKFPDCSHTHEAQCAVISAFEKGEISSLRYESYLSLMETIQEEHRRR
jgi:ribosome biogenesis GTPase / thiamine phosphate phosphatase